MDLKGSLVDTKLKIYPSKFLLNYLKNISIDNVPENIFRIAKGVDYTPTQKAKTNTKPLVISLNDKDINNLKIIKKITGDNDDATNLNCIDDEDFEVDSQSTDNGTTDDKEKISDKSESTKKIPEGPFLNTSDIDWLYNHLQNLKSSGGKDVPYLHTLLEGSHIEMPANEIIKRNPDLEARCVKLRAQQEAREYRKMTKGVDNVRLRFPEDSISYQLKQVNRQLIAIGQFIISIFAGFLFGFRGVEWMVGNLDFGFRLLLGVMCALVIALAEIYFLAKKLNEELNIPETIQLGGPPKFGSADEAPYLKTVSNSDTDKEHQD